MKRYILAAIVSLSVGNQALAHDWYPNECCSDHDCHAVPCDSLRSESGMGFAYKGEWSHGRELHFTKQMNRGPAPDGLCHVCVNSALRMPEPMCMWVGGGF